VKRIGVLVILALMVIAVVVMALSNTVTGATTMLDLPTAGATAEVDVSVAGGDRVVAYEYSLLNVCYFSGSASETPESYQREDIVNWIYAAPAPYAGVPHALLTVDLDAVPAGAMCRVFLVKGSSVVDGSTTEYTVARQ
jgi:hypothetical protein